MFSLRVPGAGQTHRSFINDSLPKVLPADWIRSAGSFNVCIFASVAKPDEELPLPYGWIALAILTGIANDKSVFLLSFAALDLRRRRRHITDANPCASSRRHLVNVKSYLTLTIELIVL